MVIPNMILSTTSYVSFVVCKLYKVNTLLSVPVIKHESDPSQAKETGGLVT